MAPIQMIPPEMYGLNPAMPGMMALMQGLGNRFSPQGREQQAVMQDTYHWWDPNTSDWRGGTPWGVRRQGDPTSNWMNPNQFYWQGQTPTPDWGASQNSARNDLLLSLLSPVGMAGVQYPDMGGAQTNLRQYPIVQDNFPIPRREEGGPVANQANPMLDLLLKMIGIDRQAGEVPIRAHQGEFVMNREATQAIGPEKLEQLNSSAQAQIPTMEGGGEITDWGKVYIDRREYFDEAVAGKYGQRAQQEAQAFLDKLNATNTGFPQVGGGGGIRPGQVETVDLPQSRGGESRDIPFNPAPSVPGPMELLQQFMASQMGPQLQAGSWAEAGQQARQEAVSAPSDVGAGRPLVSQSYGNDYLTELARRQSMLPAGLNTPITPTGQDINPGGADIFIEPDTNAATHKSAGVAIEQKEKETEPMTAIFNALMASGLGLPDLVKALAFSGLAGSAAPIAVSPDDMMNFQGGGTGASKVSPELVLDSQTRFAPPKPAPKPEGKPAITDTTQQATTLPSNNQDAATVPEKVASSTELGTVPEAGMQAPGFRAYNQPMDIPWEQIYQLPFGEAMQVLQQYADTQGQPFQPRIGAGGEVTPASPIPASMQLMQGLMGQYQGGLGADASIAGTEATRAQTEQVAPMAEADIKYKEALTEYNSALAQQATIGNLLGSPTFNDYGPKEKADIMNVYIDNQAKILDSAKALALATDKDEHWQEYMRQYVYQQFLVKGPEATIDTIPGIPTDAKERQARMAGKRTVSADEIEAIRGEVMAFIDRVQNPQSQDFFSVWAQLQNQGE